MYQNISDSIHAGLLCGGCGPILGVFGHNMMEKEHNVYKNPFDV